MDSLSYCCPPRRQHHFCTAHCVGVQAAETSAEVRQFVSYFRHFFFRHAHPRYLPPYAIGSPGWSAYALKQHFYGSQYISDGASRPTISGPVGIVSE